MHWIFQSDTPVGNVVFNFRCNSIADLAQFAQGYHEAGKRLTTILEDSGGYRDFDGYPILFLYRHALELYMKAIIYRGAELAHLVDTRTIDTSKIFKTHRFSLLLPGIKAVLEEMGWTWETGAGRIRSFSDFKELVLGIEVLDPESYSFRYPIDTKGVEALEHHTRINVVFFANNMDSVLEVLSDLVQALHVEFDILVEAKLELQNSLDRIDQESNPAGL